MPPLRAYALAFSSLLTGGAFVHTLFSKRRKQLGAILGRDRTWPEGIDPKQRPETLAVADIVRLWRASS